MSNYKAPWWPSPSFRWSECSIFESSPNTQKVGSSKMSRMNTKDFFLKNGHKIEISFQMFVTKISGLPSAVILMAENPVPPVEPIY